MSDDSEEDIKKLSKRPEIKMKSKNGALWKEMLEEESLMLDMQTCEVGKNFRKRKIDRGAESYDYAKDDLDKCQQFLKDEASASVSEKKKFKRSKGYVDKSPIYLDDLIDPIILNDEQFIEDIARKLHEENLEIIKKVVVTIGREECVAYYNKTKSIENNGGLLTFNKERRRTSGGLFLFLIKTSNNITHEQKDAIFKRSIDEKLNN